MRFYVMTLALALPMVAMAQTTVKTEATKETKTAPGSTDTTVDVKKTVDPSGPGNAKTDEHKSETKVKQNADGTTTATSKHTDTHDASGTKHDKKSTSKKTVTKDASGNVISSEKSNTSK
jgi:hypothetical protein